MGVLKSPSSDASVDLAFPCNSSDCSMIRGLLPTFWTLIPDGVPASARILSQKILEPRGTGSLEIKSAPRTELVLVFLLERGRAKRGGRLDLTLSVLTGTALSGEPITSTG